MEIASAKFQIIHDLLQHEGNMVDIQTLCELANVSRSGYYHWLKAADKRSAAEEKDRTDFALILKAYNHRGYKKGARSIYMVLLHQNPPVIMNP